MQHDDVDTSRATTAPLCLRCSVYTPPPLPEVQCIHALRPQPLQMGGGGVRGGLADWHLMFGVGV